MRPDPRLVLGLSLAAAMAMPAGAWAGPAASPPPPPPPSGGSGDEAPGGTLPGTHAAPGGRPPPGTGTAPGTPPPPSSPPPPGTGTAKPPEAPTEPQKPADLSDTWGYSRSRPLTPRYVRSSDDPGSTAPNPTGFYSGVSTGGNHVPPQPPASFDSRPYLMTWTGFERAAEGSRVYFQVNGPVKHEIQKNGLVLKLRLRNTQVNVRNNMRRLDMRYFDTPVREVRIKRVGKDMEATIELKREADPSVRLVDGKAGYKLLTLQFDDAGAGGTRSGGQDPYKSAGGGGYVGGDTTEPVQPGTGVQPGTAAGGAEANGPSAHDPAADAAAGDPAAAGAPGTSAAPTGTYALDLYIVNYD